MFWSLSVFGNVSGRRAEGLTLPNRMSAMAEPAAWPGMKFVTIAGTSSAHGVSTAPGTDITTTVLGCAAAMAETIAFCALALPTQGVPTPCRPGRVSGTQPTSSESEPRSPPPCESVATKTTCPSQLKVPD